MLLPKTTDLFEPYSGVPAVPLEASVHLLPTHDVFQFNDTGTWLENIAVRPNGDLLVTMFTPTPSLYTLKRPYSPTREFSLLHTFDNATALLGITETDTDTFAIISTQLNDASLPIPGSSAIWEVSFRDHKLNTQKITGLPDLVLPNGITSIPGSSTVLVADCLLGNVTRCNTKTGATEVVLARPETAPLPDEAESLGVNGIHYRDGYLYWSNSALVSIFRIRVDKHGNPAPDAVVETVGQIDASFIDDFALDHAGTAWVATNRENTIVALRSNGSSEVVAGSPTKFTVAGCTAAAFGRTAKDSKTLYVVTSGALRAPINGVAEPAKIVAVDTSRFS
ncbi:hypothetical protein E0Z10_g6823 [Xylaria hypoxylon]|uniref:SMP-30/Gluconolactonase/LRE-like region domain-containing protein n=1 Tax=Xylaria hypoxylon TaxID=37992 RepID=A0A4Z0YTZ8_9PEZI|nr:hypothetical protein E0Z10_g6823 [Xylaria hypoxylon]